ncbi:hypothetical protein LshimejAT787_1102880 [Lyophyllum shimeji]|uniref:Uncharacterized protein n=1 Tax=Lyophyllum shimeji TaxID=47721 RepID=A0A9P3PVD1_LYOSH|nr:hypothetical protein LshimejAT787_1102880 [Lyophyllum shimeji]
MRRKGQKRSLERLRPIDKISCKLYYRKSDAQEPGDRSVDHYCSRLVGQSCFTHVSRLSLDRRNDGPENDAEEACKEADSWATCLSFGSPSHWRVPVLHWVTPPRGRTVADAQTATKRSKKKV